MSCSCNKPLLPALGDECSTPAALVVDSPCCKDTEALSSTVSTGSTVPSWATDAVCATEDVTLLGRIGNTLARFTGSGFLQIINGKASVVSSIPIKLTDLWHKWWKPSSTARPIIGVPLDFPYATVADAQGSLHGIRGTEEEDSTHIWDSTSELFKTVPLSEVPKPQKGLLPREAALELVGYAAIPDDGAATDVRQLSSLHGSGLVVLAQQATIPSSCDCPGCDPEAAVASVASTLANPVGAGPFTLKCANGILYWSED